MRVHCEAGEPKYLIQGEVSNWRQSYTRSGHRYRGRREAPGTMRLSFFLLGTSFFIYSGRTPARGTRTLSGPAHMALAAEGTRLMYASASVLCGRHSGEVRVIAEDATGYARRISRGECGYSAFGHGRRGAVRRTGTSLSEARRCDRNGLCVSSQWCHALLRKDRVCSVQSISSALRASASNHLL
ncbi:hypothetical protein FKP32DRAFT_1260369 [Trametes sanguinea]|nr:hypothetical protein FKP32DRAFT_1260369 [Trametes sanguinea]